MKNPLFGRRPATKAMDVLRMKKAYLDNMIACGIVRNNLQPAEKKAVSKLWDACAAGTLEIATSRLSWDEQNRTKDPAWRAKFEAARPNIRVIENDTRIVGGSQANFHDGGVTVSANLSGILHQPLYNDLRALGLEPADAQHLHYAAHHRAFDFFVTLDGDFLSRRAKLEARCGGVRIVKPTKLVRLL